MGSDPPEISGEMGSFWHFAEQWFVRDESTRELPSFMNGAVLFGSGRDAIRAWLRSQTAIERVWIPSYYCHDVTDVISKEFEVVIYRSGPDCRNNRTLLQTAPNDVTIVIEYFGLKSDVRCSRGAIALDRTMCPWADHHYGPVPGIIFGSLRKALPFPDGGWIQIPDSVPNSSLSIPSSGRHEEQARRVHEAMIAKGLYLSTGQPEKSSFLHLLSQNDAKIVDDDEISGPSQFTRHGVSKVNEKIFAEALRRNLGQINKHRPTGWRLARRLPAESHLALLCDGPTFREELRSALIERSIFPAVLWPIPEYIDDERAHLLSSRILVLHVDARYDSSQIMRLMNQLDGLAGGPCD